jgi:hypothetical protein
MGKLQNGCPVFDTSIIKGVFSTTAIRYEVRKRMNEDLRIVKYPKEALKIDFERILED